MHQNICKDWKISNLTEVIKPSEKLQLKSSSKEKLTKKKGERYERNYEWKQCENSYCPYPLNIHENFNISSK